MYCLSAIATEVIAIASYSPHNYLQLSLDDIQVEAIYAWAHPQYSVCIQLHVTCKQ
jgi:hypothetical protein